LAKDIKVAILGDARDFTQAVNKVERGLSGMSGRFNSLGSSAARMGRNISIGLGAVAVGAVAVGKSLIDAATESQKVTAQTEAVLKSMGTAAGVTSKQVADLSTKLSMQSGVDDELIQSGSNLLLTFGQIRNGVGKANQIFDRATAAALDMSVALGTDMTSASMMVGKALNDPVRGLTALRRSGIQFTKQQEDQIKAMVAVGDAAGAQKIMLSELERQFGGSAAAQATAGEKLAVIWGNLQEQLGEKLLPVFSSVATWLGRVLPRAIDAFSSFLRPIIDTIQEFGNALRTGMSEDEGTRIEEFAFKIRDAFFAVRDFFRDHLIPTIQGLVDNALQGISDWWDRNGETVIGFFSTLGEVAVRIFEEISDVITDYVLPNLIKLATWLADHKEAMVGVLAVIAAGFVSWAISAGMAAAATLAATWPIVAIIVVIGAIAVALKWAYDNWGWFRDGVNQAAVAAIMFTQFAGGAVGVIKSIAGFALDAAAAVGRLVDALARLPNMSLTGTRGLDEAVAKARAQSSPQVRKAQGGRVPGSLHQPVPIIAHGGEMVLTAGQAKRGGSGGGDTIVIQVGDREIARLYADGKVSAERRGIAA